MSLTTIQTNEAVKEKLREASQYARCHSERLTHDQVFDGLQQIIVRSRDQEA